MSDEYEGLLALNYDALYGVMRDPSGDAAFYRALAQEAGGPVLELACGTGRVLLPIAALGIPASASTRRRRCSRSCAARIRRPTWSWCRRAWRPSISAGGGSR